MAVVISGTAGINTPGLESAAMPTVDGAAVVESGSNSDGMWTKFADGSQLAYGSAICFAGDNTSEIKDGREPFPVSFVGEVYVSGVNNSVTNWRIFAGATDGQGNAGADFAWTGQRLSGAWVSGIDYGVPFLAMGRWK